MISPTTKQSTFLTGFNELFPRIQKSSPGWLNAIHQNGVNRFQQLGLPTPKDEEWKYTNVASIAAKKFHIPSTHTLLENDELTAYTNDSDILLVFVNGIFDKKLSSVSQFPAKCEILNFADLNEKDTQFLQPYLDKYSLQGEETFAALNRSLMHHGTVVRIADKAIFEKLIHIVHVVSGEEHDILVSPRTLVLLGRLSEAQILESYISFSPVSYFTNAVTDIFLADDSKLRYYKTQGEGANAFHIGTTRVWQERNSQLESFSFSTGAQLARNNLTIALNGAGAGTILNGLYAATDEQLVDNHTVVDHREPNATSNQLYKGILDGNAKAVFNGKIFVKQIAQKTNAYQLNKNLMLGKGCQVNTKPQLEIFADDVKCTHGATIGQLNEDEMFYLQARAIPKKTAVKMLSRGFVNDILGRVNNESVRKKMNHLLTNAFSVLS